MSDSFAQEGIVTPVAIEDISVELFDAGPSSGETRSAHATIQVRMSDGTVRVRRYNLANHVGNATLNQLVNFVSTIRTKAEAEILPAQET